MKHGTSMRMQSSRNGQTVLSLVFVIGGIIVLFGTTLALLALSFLNSTYGFQAANRAAAIARGGLADVTLQLERNKNLPGGSYCIPYASPPCPAGYAQVTVVQEATEDDGQAIVTSEATVSFYRRKYQATFSVNANTGLVKLVSLEQL